MNVLCFNLRKPVGMTTEKLHGRDDPFRYVLPVYPRFPLDLPECLPESEILT